MQPVVLLTGATGVLGPELIYELLRSTPAEVVCVVRADDEPAAEQRLRGVVARLLGERGWADVRGRLSAVSGDVTLPLLGLSDQVLRDIARRVTHILHGAASVRFDHDLATARRINLGGTKSVLNFARICHRRGHLERLGYVSTAFVGGRYPRRFGEDDLARGQAFRNTYERSKYEAELVLAAHQHKVPTTIIRPSIVVGHSRGGFTTGFNVIYWPLRVYADGALRLAAVAPQLPVDMVPVDFVARGTIEAVLGRGRPGATYALAAGRRAMEAREIAALASEVFQVSPPRLISTPLDQVVAPLVGRMMGFGPWRPYARGFRQYLPYFLHASAFDTEHADRLLGPARIVAPPVTELLRPVLEFARETDFGRDRKRLTEMETGFADERRRALSHPRGDTDLELAGSPRSAAQRRVPATTGRQQG